ncbi:hypothetical protein EVAR_59145_1 [Eumeta japonica]|uniref:Uncharacterized protein n=1 Tax=Eumeta variegata TaxID=151549 RepID=A0A4C1ZEX1_EUMVA|nr:hypothetical protein EVAR_59145_1 [Eumeta japonica]
MGPLKSGAAAATETEHKVDISSPAPDRRIRLAGTCRRVWNNKTISRIRGRGGRGPAPAVLRGDEGRGGQWRIALHAAGDNEGRLAPRNFHGPRADAIKT